MMTKNCASKRFGSSGLVQKPSSPVTLIIKGGNQALLRKSAVESTPVANNVISVKLILCIFIPCWTIQTWNRKNDGRS